MTEYEIKRLENRIRELWNEKEDLLKEKEELENQNRLLGERCNQLLKDKGELTDKIADIKANCDLAIEGRDIKIKELELELTVEKDLHQEETNLHLHAEDYIKSLEQKLEQTEKDLADYQFNYPKIKELEKENTELRDKIEHRNCVDCSNHGSNIKLTKAKEIVKGLYFIIQSRIDYANNTGIADEMWRAEQFIR